MAKLEWGAQPPVYDLGVDQGVLYLDDGAKPWNGLVSVEERPAGSVETEHFFDGNRVHISQELGDFEGVINAYTYPEEFAEYNGYSDRKAFKKFDMSYRTQSENGHRLHLVYNAMVVPSDRSWRTISSSPEPSLFSWNFVTTPVPVPGGSPAGHLVLDTNEFPEVAAAFDDVLYGTDTTAPRMPTPAELVDIYEDATNFKVVYNGDGTWTATGEADQIVTNLDGSFYISAPSVYTTRKGVFLVRSS